MLIETFELKETKLMTRLSVKIVGGQIFSWLDKTKFVFNWLKFTEMKETSESRRILLGSGWGRYTANVMLSVTLVWRWALIKSLAPNDL
jgi:hypothetical protein